MDLFRPASSHSSMAHRWRQTGIAALGLAACCAIVLVCARTPGLAGMVDPALFQRGLVLHVGLATLVWLLAMACSLWVQTHRACCPSKLRLLTAAHVVFVAGAVGLVVNSISGDGHPVLADYIPYLDTPAYIGALLLIGAGAAVTAALTLESPRSNADLALLAMRLPILLAIVEPAVRVAIGHDLAAAFWSAGHLLQFAWIMLVLAVWLRVEEADAPRPHLRFALLLGLAVLPSTIPLAWLVLATPASAALDALHTALMKWTLWPVAALLILTLLRPGEGRPFAHNAAVALLVTGAAAALMIDGQTTAIPAHYHGTLGAVTLVMVALVAPGALFVHRLFAAGTGFMITGMLVSGLFGVARKQALGASQLEPTAALAGLLTGIGGFLVVAAVVLFVRHACRAPSPCPQPGPAPRTPPQTYVSAR